MDRFTISLDENLATAFDELIRIRGYTTRSEAVRDILRTHLQSKPRAARFEGVVRRESVVRLQSS